LPQVENRDDHGHGGLNDVENGIITVAKRSTAEVAIMLAEEVGVFGDPSRGVVP